MYVAGRLSELDPVLLEALWLQHGLGRLGFGADEISVMVATAAKGHAKVALVRDPPIEVGDRILAVRLLQIPVSWYGTVGKMPCGDEAFASRWNDAVLAFADAPASEAEPLWQRSRAFAALPELASVLTEKGFKVRS
jgi:hypothetical protein